MRKSGERETKRHRQGQKPTDGDRQAGRQAGRQASKQTDIMRQRQGEKREREEGRERERESAERKLHAIFHVRFIPEKERTAEDSFGGKKGKQRRKKESRGRDKQTE